MSVYLDNLDNVLGRLEEYYSPQNRSLLDIGDRKPSLSQKIFSTKKGPLLKEEKTIQNIITKAPPAEVAQDEKHKKLYRRCVSLLYRQGPDVFSQCLGERLETDLKEAFGQEKWNNPKFRSLALPLYCQIILSSNKDFTPDDLLEIFSHVQKKTENKEQEIENREEKLISIYKSLNATAHVLSVVYRQLIEGVLNKPFPQVISAAMHQITPRPVGEDVQRLCKAQARILSLEGALF